MRRLAWTLPLCALLVAGCLSPQPAAPARFEAPACAPADEACVARNADAFVAWRMGEHAGILSRERVVQVDVPESCRGSGSCGPDPTQWEVVYRLRAPDAPWADALFGVSLTRDASIVLDDGGVPACRIVPSECALAITADEARLIARAAGLGGSEGAWGASFAGHRTLGLVWNVANATHGSVGGVGEGHAVTVDANDGRVLQRVGWAAMS